MTSPFPWGRLDAVSKDDARAARALAPWAARVGEALSSLLETHVDVALGRVMRSRAREPLDGVAVLIGGGGGESHREVAIVEAEPALGATLVARSLRRRGPREVAVDGAQTALGGSLAAIVAATGRKLRDGRALRVVAAGPARVLEAQRAPIGGSEIVTASLTVVVNARSYAARVVVLDADPLAADANARWTRAELARLGDIPLAMPIVAAVSRSTATTIGSLRAGDAWVPGAWSLRRTSAGALTGPVLLAAPSHDRALRAVLGEDGRVVVREGTEQIGAEEDGVSEADEDARVDIVGEVPVVVRVEIGVAEMRAREWAALAPGDVVALGRKIGEPVTLRVGGVTVARGELVDLDGEVAVRLLGRGGER